MKISVEKSDGKAFSIKIPNWLVLNRLGAGFIAKSIVKSSNLGVCVNVNGNEKETPKALDKKELKIATKKMRRALISVLRELRGFLKRNSNFVLVDVVDTDGECVKITL